MYDHLTSHMYNFKSLEMMYAEMQAQSEMDKLNAYRYLVTKCTNVYNPLQPCKEEVEVETVNEGYGASEHTVRKFTGCTATCTMKVKVDGG